MSPRAVIRRKSDGLVLLLKRPSDSRHFPARWEFPGGKPDPGEDFVETLVRETREETGLEIAPGSVLGVTEERIDDKLITFLFVEATSEESEIQVRAGEHNDHRWVDLGELARLAATPEPDDSEDTSHTEAGVDRLVPPFRAFALEFAQRHGYAARPSAAPAEATTDAGEVSHPLDGWVERLQFGLLAGCHFLSYPLRSRTHIFHHKYGKTHSVRDETQLKVFLQRKLN